MATKTTDFSGEKRQPAKADEDVLETSADPLRAFNDPTEDPYHTRGMDPAAAEAGFRAAGLTEPGPLAGRKPGDKLALADSNPHGDTDIAREGGPNPSADQPPAPGGVIREGDALIAPDSQIAAEQTESSHRTTSQTAAEKKDSAKKAATSAEKK